MDLVALALLAVLSVGTLSMLAHKRASAINALMTPARRQAWGELYGLIGEYSSELMADSEQHPGSIAALAPFNGMILGVDNETSSVYITRFTAEPETYVIRRVGHIDGVWAGQIVFPGDEVCTIVSDDILHFDVYYAVTVPSRLPESARETDPQAWAASHGILTGEAIWAAYG